MSLGHANVTHHKSIIIDQIENLKKTNVYLFWPLLLVGILLMANSDLRNIFVLFTQEICKISGKICGHIAAIVGPSSPDIDND